jgi:hypothetical protein
LRYAHKLIMSKKTKIIAPQASVNAFVIKNIHAKIYIRIAARRTEIYTALMGVCVRSLSAHINNEPAGPRHAYCVLINRREPMVRFFGRAPNTFI